MGVRRKGSRDVRQPQGQLSRVGTFRSLLNRFAFISLIVLCFALMLFGKADTLMVARLRAAAVDVITPVLDVLARPADAISDVVGNMRELTSIRQENQRLKDLNARLLAWQEAAQKLDAENRRLRAALNSVQDNEIHFSTARVVADAGGAFAQSMLVTAGARDGVAKGQAAVAPEGLVGRVMDVGVQSSRILLLTDINSRIPVKIGDLETRAILAGDNTIRPRLMFISKKAAITPGDRVVTSGDAGAFPPGLPIGAVTSVGEADVRVEPFFTRDSLGYVRLVDYGLTAILTDPEDTE